MDRNFKCLKGLLIYIAAIYFLSGTRVDSLLTGGRRLPHYHAVSAEDIANNYSVTVKDYDRTYGYCPGIVLRDPFGVIYRYNRFMRPCHNLRCTFRIRAKMKHYIRITFTVFLLQKPLPGGKRSDHIRIFDGRERKPVIIDGDAKPPFSYVSASNRLTVIFATYKKIESQGFRAFYRQVKSPAPESNGCPSATLRDWSGVITSPGFPLTRAPNHLRCNIVIQAKEGHYIRISFTDFHLQKRLDGGRSSDFVKITDGAEEDPVKNKTYHGGESTSFIFVSSTNRITIQFVTDNRTRSIGFRAIYHQVKDRSCMNLEERLGVEFSCTEGWEYLSKCIMNCKIGHTFETNQHLEGLKPTILVVCRQDAEGNPAWVAESLNSSSSTIRAPRGTGLLANDGTAVSLRCEKIRCEPPEDIEIVFCLRNTGNHSKCKMQCRDEFVPSPQLYNTDSSSVELARIQQFLPHFWDNCRHISDEQETFSWEHDIANRSSSAHLSCMDEDSLAEVCLADLDNIDDDIDYDDYVFEYDASSGQQIVWERTFQNVRPDCPYQLEQLLEFYNEEGEGTPELPITRNTSIDLEELGIERLSSTEIDDVIDNLRYRLREFCLNNLKQHLRNNYMGLPNDSNDAEIVEYVTPQIYEESAEICKSSPNAFDWISQTEHEKGLLHVSREHPCRRFCGNCKRFFKISKKLNCMKCHQDGHCKIYKTFR